MTFFLYVLLNFDKAYERQCEEQQPTNTCKCPEIDKLIDVINIWFTSKMVVDCPFGFINMQNIEIRDYIPIELVVGSKPCSMRYKEDLSVIYNIFIRKYSIGNKNIF